MRFSEPVFIRRCPGSTPRQSRRSMALPPKCWPWTFPPAPMPTRLRRRLAPLPGRTRLRPSPLPRPAHLFGNLSPGPVVVAPIGSPPEAIASALNLFAITAQDVAPLLAPARSRCQQRPLWSRAGDRRFPGKVWRARHGWHGGVARRSRAGDGGHGRFGLAAGGRPRDGADDRTVCLKPQAALSDGLLWAICRR